MTTVYIQQSVEKIDSDTYEVKIVVGEEVKERLYEGANGIYPVYHSIIEELRELKDVEVEVATTSDRIVKEYHQFENKNARLLQKLRKVVERNGLEVAFYEL